MDREKAIERENERWREKKKKETNKNVSRHTIEKKTLGTNKSNRLKNFISVQRNGNMTERYIHKLGKKMFI